MVMTMSNKENLITVSNLMLKLNQFPIINEKTILKEALDLMDQSKLGVVCIVDAKKNLNGIITDGDLRRKLLSIQKPFSALLIDNVIDHANKNPKSVLKNTKIRDAIVYMEKNQIWDLPVVDEKNRLLGLLHLHNAIKHLLK